MRFFNTTGPCDPARHYMLPAEPRLPEARFDERAGAPEIGERLSRATETTPSGRPVTVLWL